MKQVVIALLLGSLNVIGTHSVMGFKLLEHTDIDGVKYVYQVEKELVQVTPSWDGKSSELPLSLGKAVSIAINWVTQKEKNNILKVPTVLSFGKDVTFVTNWVTQKGEIRLEVQRLSLSRIYERGIRDKWYYSIVVDAKYQDTKFSKMSYTIVILLDGTVVEPEIK